MNNERMEELQEAGYSCSQTVLAYFAPKYHLAEEVALKLAQGFEAGMYQADTCGSVTGAYMVIGLALGGQTKEAKGQVVQTMTRFNEAFAKEMGSLNCQQILGTNIMLPGNMEKALEEKKIQTTCPKAMATAIKILEELLP